MTRRQRQRLEDILVAIESIRHHLERGDLEDGLVFDAVRVRLIEIGEAVSAVKSLPADVLAQELTLPRSQISAMRDRLAHRYFDTSHAIVRATVDRDLPDLEGAVRCLAASIGDN
ncbi:MAG: DUF86 domain-containing protein [Actinomycetota bacterium]|nr:DUF86 domain-containing protein [Actinomycetota bacterium]